MDILAALALVLVIEGCALAILARSLPEMMALVGAIPPESLKLGGVVLAVVGGALYLLVRS